MQIHPTGLSVIVVSYRLEPWLLTPITNPQTRKDELYKKMQIKARNTVERAFGVLKTRFRCLN